MLSRLYDALPRTHGNYSRAPCAGPWKGARWLMRRPLEDTSISWRFRGIIPGFRPYRANFCVGIQCIEFAEGVEKLAFVNEEREVYCGYKPNSLRLGWISKDLLICLRSMQIPSGPFSVCKVLIRICINSKFCACAGCGIRRAIRHIFPSKQFNKHPFMICAMDEYNATKVIYYNQCPPHLPDWLWRESR